MRFVANLKNKCSKKAIGQKGCISNPKNRKKFIPFLNQNYRWDDNSDRGAADLCLFLFSFKFIISIISS